MPKSKEELEKLKSKRMDEIVLAGLKVFCEKGYESATVDDIVKKANCSHGLFYHYFKSKKDIFDAVILNRRNDTEKNIEAIFNENISSVEMLKKLTTLFFENFANDENFAYHYLFNVMLLFSINSSGLNVPDGYKLQERKLKPSLEKLFNAGQKSGEFTDKYSVTDCCVLYHSLIQGATLNYTLLPPQKKHVLPLPNIDFIVDIFKA